MESAQSSSWLAGRREPIAFLALGLAAFAGLALRGGLLLERSRDSAGYLWEGRSLASALADFRTPGYPLFLWLLRPLGPDFDALPALQFLLHAAAVALFAGSLRRFGASPACALVTAAPLLGLSIAWRSARVLGPDSLAATLAIVTLAALLAALARPHQSRGWLAVSGALAATCLVRPAYLFLVPLLPCLAVALAPLAPSRPAPLLRATGLALAASLPLLLYALLRLAVIGEFGLVAAGGTNVIGTTAWLLDESVLERVAPEQRPLATAIHGEARRRGLPAPLPGEPLPLGALYRSYNVYVWEIAVPAAEAHFGGSYAERTPEIDAAFGSIAATAIRARPGLYARVVGAFFFDGTLRSLSNEPLLRPLLGACLALAALAAARRGRGLWPLRVEEWRLPLTVTAVAVAYFSAKMLLVSLVETPEARYLAAAALFLPAAAAAWCWALARHAFGAASVQPARAVAESA